MSGTAPGTSGGASGTSGAHRRRVLWLTLGALIFTAVQSIANVESTLSDLAALDRIESAANVWIWQLSSAGVWFALFVPLWWLVATLRPPRFGWSMATALHALATIPISLVHVAAMVAIRKLAYALTAQTYDFGDWPRGLLYEYRKDVATYLIAVAFVAFAQWLLTRPEPEAEADILLVADGNVTHRIPVAEIASVGSAGNYVEIVWGGRTLLHRATLAALGDRLGPGFARIHRGRLVRRAAVARIETERSGDFIVTLHDGAQLRGSRRYRTAL